MNHIDIQAKKTNMYRFIIILTVSFILVFPQLINRSIILGVDSIFHFNRIYDTYMQFKTGNFSYFQSNYGFQQSGRIINALYGPLLAYVLGGILYIVHSWLKFQIIVSFFTFFIGGYTINKLSTEIGISSKVANINSILFMGSFWVSRWVVEQKFMSLGVIFMPLVVLMGVKFLNNDEKEIKVIPLALIISLIIQIHVLSALISILVLGCFFIVAVVKNTKKMELFFKCIQAGILSLILTFNVWWALLEIYSSNHLYAPYASNLAKSTMNFSIGDAGGWHIGLMISMIFLLQISLYFLYQKEISILNKTITTIGISLVVLTSNIFPWNLVDQKIPALKSFLQFPSRFEGMAFILLVIGLGLSMIELKRRSFKEITTIFLMIVALFGVIQTYRDVQQTSEIWNSQNAVANRKNVIFKTDNSNKIRAAFRSSDLQRGLELLEKPTPDYIAIPDAKIESAHAYDQYNEDFMSNKFDGSKSIKGNTLYVTWNSKEKEQIKKIPVTVYKNSKLTLDGKQLSKNEVRLDAMGVPTVHSNKSGKNVLTLNYKSNVLNSFTLWVIYGVWMICGLILIFSKVRRKTYEQ